VGIVLGRSITSNNYATIGFQYIGDGSASNYVGIGVTNPTTLCITAGGNVGIGTTVANAPLQFENTVASRKIVLYDNGNDDHQFYGFGINGAVLRYQVSATSTSHVFYAGVTASISTELMRITGTGNVGIGTASPQYHLDVAGTVRNSVNLFSDNSAMVSATPALDYTTFGQNWTTGNTSVTGSYIGCSMSANGQYQIICFYTTGGIYYSSNYGQTWALATSTSTISWIACEMSASGQYCIATVQLASGLIYISSNYGQTWSSTGQATIHQTRCAISGTGQYMIACGGVGGGSSPIYVSNNYGATWTSVGPTLTWLSCAMSTSGQYMYAGTSSATAVYVSSNYGQTWTPVVVYSSATTSFSITCSADF
jgi:hypothetical protein